MVELYQRPVALAGQLQLESLIGAAPRITTNDRFRNGVIWTYGLTYEEKRHVISVNRYARMAASGEHSKVLATFRHRSTAVTQSITLSTSKT